MLHCVDLNVKCCNHLFDTFLVLLSDFLIDFDLLNGQELARRRIHAQIDSSISAFSNQLAANDLECRLSLGCVLVWNFFLRNGIKRAETIAGLRSNLHDIRAEHFCALAPNMNARDIGLRLCNT